MYHYIHCHQRFDTNKGGTVGYLSQLFLGMQDLETFTSHLGVRHAFLFPQENKPNFVDEDNKKVSEFEHIYQYATNSDLAYCRNYSKQFHSVIPYTEFRKIKFHKISSIHIHGAYNFLPVYNALKKIGIEKDVVKILTTHNPWKPELEDLESMEKAGILAWQERKHVSFFLHERDKFAFENSDVLLFPCEESMEGYYRHWPEFANIVQKKKVVFSLTGANPKQVTTPSDFLRRHLGIPEASTVFLYLGRFMGVRGFDIFLEAARKVLSQRNDIYFLAVGEKRETPALNHPCWIEIPFTSHPGDYFKLADACVCASRDNYFDLSMIEIMASGTPYLAANVGGCKWLAGKTSGVIYFEPENVDDLVQRMLEFTNLDPATKEAMRQDNLNLYAAKLTVKHFAQGYLDAIDGIYEACNVTAVSRGIVSPVYGGAVQAVTMADWFGKPDVPNIPSLEARYKSAQQWRKVSVLILLDCHRLKANIRKKYPNSLCMGFLASVVPNFMGTAPTNLNLEQRYKLAPQWIKISSLSLLDRQRLKKNIRKKYEDILKRKPSKL